ncbi:hypothetical protein Vadar_004212 [Vaccinium darrowii]|uniref:Uncharacterized protein n=1 Tax=Vaccinium darrowii TaxID=229202 RepID=A0ACB7WXV8_9ERIC|nr:hypothetical protein Vadar_004212 [Vaccinium darrowii]
MPSPLRKAGGDLRNDVLMCKVFPSSLGEANLQWFDKLEAESITSWKQLLMVFTARINGESGATCKDRGGQQVDRGGIGVSLEDNKIGRDGEPSKGRSNPNKAIITVFKEPIYKLLPQIQNEPYFSWPPKMTGDSNKRDSTLRCSYHRDHGHMTDSCKTFKQHLEDLVVAGHLKQFIDNAD